MILASARSAHVVSVLVLSVVGFSHDDAHVQRTHVQAGRSANEDSLVILPGRLGPIDACDALSKVNGAFPGRTIRDTVYREAGSHWPAKVVLLKDGVLVFSSSWTDTARVWNMNTTSPSVRTRRGFHVGMRLGDIMALDSLEVELPEGVVVVSLKREGVGVLIDQSGQKRFYETFNFKGTPSAAMLPASAVITELVTGGGC